MMRKPTRSDSHPSRAEQSSILPALFLILALALGGGGSPSPLPEMFLEGLAALFARLQQTDRPDWKRRLHFRQRME